MAHTIRFAPPNSLLFVSDPDGGTAPPITRGTAPRLWSTPSCIAVGCLAFMDGPTEVTLGASREVNPGSPPAFDGMLETPNRAVVVSTVEHERILKANVPQSRTRVRIWVNDLVEPDRVIIGLN